MIIITTEGGKTIIEITVRPINMFFRGILAVLILSPLTMLLPLFLSDKKVASTFGFFIGFMLWGLVSVYLLRTLLYNIYGKEIYTISETEFSTVNDYGWFKDNPQKVSSYSEINLYYAWEEDPGEKVVLNAESVKEADPATQ